MGEDYTGIPAAQYKFRVLGKPLLDEVVSSDHCSNKTWQFYLIVKSPCAISP